MDGNYNINGNRWKICWWKANKKKLKKYIYQHIGKYIRANEGKNYDSLEGNAESVKSKW